MIKLADPRNRIGGYYQPPDPPEDDDEGDGGGGGNDGDGCLLTLFSWFALTTVGTIVVLMLLKCVRVAWEILWK